MSDTTDIQGDYIEGDYIDGDYVGRDKITVGDVLGTLIIGDGNTINLPPPRPDAVDNLRPLNPNFTGRQEVLANIAKTFASTVSPIVMTQAISGMGGVGKTQVALAYAHTHRDKYDIIWLLQANDTIALDNSLRQLGERLELAVAGKDMETMRHIVLSYLGSNRKNVLLLYDNADQIAPHDLFPYLPSGCHILIISRRKATQWSEIAKTMTLGVWTEAEAALFWQRRLGRELIAAEEVALAELADELGFLPLAMEQAAALLGNDKLNMSVTAYLEEFKVERELLRGKGTSPIYYHDGLTVTTTWILAFNRVKQTAGAADLLNLCSFFAPEDIPLAVIQKHAISLPVPLFTILMDKDKREDALAALSDYSLLAITDGMLNMHRLVQAVARERIEVKGQMWLEAVQDLLFMAYHFDPNDTSTWAQCGQLLPHLIATVTLSTEWDVNSKQAAYLNNEIGIYHEQYGNYAVARPFFESALSIAEKQYGSEHPNVAVDLNNLGQLLSTLGELKDALPLYERALSICEKQLGSEHPFTAVSLNSMGSLLESMGKHEEALLLHKRALVINEKQFGVDHPTTAISLSNLGYLLESMEKYSEARPYYERALVILTDKLGADHPNTATGFNNLGGLLESMGKYEEALPLHKRSLAINEKQFGTDHLLTASSLNNIGYLLESMEKYSEARPYYERALTIHKRQLGFNHPDTATSLNNLGGLLESMGEDEEASLLYKKALYIRQKMLGHNHPSTATSFNNLAWLLYKKGEKSEAIQLMRQALVILETVLGSDHSHTQSCRQSLATFEDAT